MVQHMKIVCLSVGFLVALGSLSSVSSAIRQDAKTDKKVTGVSLAAVLRF